MSPGPQWPHIQRNCGASVILPVHWDHFHCCSYVSSSEMSWKICILEKLWMDPKLFSWEWTYLLISFPHEPFIIPLYFHSVSQLSVFCIPKVQLTFDTATQGSWRESWNFRKSKSLRGGVNSRSTTSGVTFVFYDISSSVSVTQALSIPSHLLKPSPWHVSTGTRAWFVGISLLALAIILFELFRIRS